MLDSSALSIPMTPNVAHFLEVKESNRKKRIDKCKTSESKKARNVTTSSTKFG